MSWIGLRLVWPLRFCLALGLLYLFLVGINVLETSIKTATTGVINDGIGLLTNPFAALAFGVLVTVMVQSSSATTSMIVAAVGTRLLTVEQAVPMVMGANIGTSVTSTIVSLGHVTRSDEFRRAFAGATVHDFFNIITVAILFPIELLTRWLSSGRGILSSMAAWLVQFLPAGQTGEKTRSWIKISIKWLGGKIKAVFEDGLGLQGGWLATVLFVVAIVMILTTLYFITRNMRKLMARRIEAWLNRALRRSMLLGWVVGIVITVLVQSSSITTSLLVPMFGAGILVLEAGFPILVGANIGTTVTALLASLVVTENQQEAVTIAVVHLLFNCAGTLMFLPFPQMRRIPIGCAEWLAKKSVENKVWVLGYLLVVFVLMPLLGYMIWT